MAVKFQSDTDPWYKRFGSKLNVKISVEAHSRKFAIIDQFRTMSMDESTKRKTIFEAVSGTQTKLWWTHMTQQIFAIYQFYQWSLPSVCDCIPWGILVHMVTNGLYTSAPYSVLNTGAVAWTIFELLNDSHAFKAAKWIHQIGLFVCVCFYSFNCLINHVFSTISIDRPSGNR